MGEVVWARLSCKQPCPLSSWGRYATVLCTAQVCYSEWGTLVWNWKRLAYGPIRYICMQPDTFGCL